MKPHEPFPSRPLRVYAQVAKGFLWLLMALWLVLALAWGALHWWIVPRIGELRPELELQAQRALGVPVRIGSISAYSEGLIPSFELLDVVLLDPQGRPALTLPRVLAALSPQSLWNLGFEQLYIDRPALDVRRAADGRIYVAGLDFSHSSDNEGKGADWFFSQSEFIIRGGTIRWTDEKRGAAPLELQSVDFVMRNGHRRHGLRLDATPPAEWGDRFTLRGMFRQPLFSARSGHWQDWTGQLHADFERVDVTQLRRYADVGVEVTQGRGAVRAWIDVDRGQFAGGTADIAMADVSARLAASLEPLALRTASGRIGGKRLSDGGFEFETQNLQFETSEGQRWPGGNVFVAWSPGQTLHSAQGELRADKLDLFALSQLASRLPLGAATHKALATYAPRGFVERLQARWQGPVDALQSYEAHGRAVRLEIAAHASETPASGARPHAGTPGVRGLAVDFDFTQDGGKGKVAIAHGAVDFPGVFEEPVIPVDELSAEVQWRTDGKAISATLSNLKFSSADAQGEARATWKTSAGAARFPGEIDLQGTLGRADGTKVYRYLPLGVPKAARDYVHEAVTQGAASNVKFKLKGDLAEFPFRDPKRGEFHIEADIHNANFAYVPRSINKAGVQWPALTQLSALLVFDRNGMEVRNAAGRIATATGLQLKADARIPHYDAAVVDVAGTVKGPLPQALSFVNASPLAAMTNQALSKAAGTGNADVRLHLQLPVATIEKSQVQGTVTLAGNDVQVTPDSPLLSRAKGVVTFSEQGFALVGTQARALGGDVRIDGGSRPNVTPNSAEPSVLLRAQGTATAEGLRQARELGFVSRLAKDASGASAYSVTLAVRRGTPEIAVTSSLQGLATGLPAPFAKTAETALPLRYESALMRESFAAGAKPVDQLSVDLGRVASIVYQRDVSGAEPRVLRGAIAVGLAPGESAALPEQGVSANVNLGVVNIDAWEAALNQATGTAPQAMRSQGASAAMGYLPTSMAIRARDLTVEGRSLHNVVVGGSRDNLTWRANVDAAELNGYLEYRQASSANASGRLHARLARLAIGASAAKDVESLLDEQPETLPGLDIVVDDFDLKGKKLGRLEIDAVNRGGPAAREGGVREWRLNKLNLTVPEAAFTATGNWASVNAQSSPPSVARPGAKAAAERRRTVMNFKLDVADSGQLLGRMGMKDVVRRGKGKLEGQVAWLGSPLSLDYPSMNGNLYVNMEAGQFLKADPGLAKLLGVLSLQSLPRRLTLDFRDVFSEGFAFDFVRGDVTIQQGIAATNNLQMKGVNAAVLMDGKADIARETQDIKVVVVPEINAGTASIVAAAINPAIGIGSFLAQLFLRQPLIRATTQEFHIDGTWADPRITKVDHRAAAAEARADPASEARPAR